MANIYQRNKSDSVGRRFRLAGVVMLLAVAFTGTVHAQLTNIQFTTASDGKDGLVITGFSATGSGPLVIPPSINGVAVISIGTDAFNNCTNVTSVTIPSSVTNIEDGAFESCTALTNAIFVGNAPEMGSGVFLNSDKGFTVSYYNGTTGFTSPIWVDSSGDAYPAVSQGNYLLTKTTSGATGGSTRGTVLNGRSGAGSDSSTVLNAKGLQSGSSIINAAGVTSGTNQGIEGNPQDAQAYFKRAYVYMTTGEDDKALADLTQAIQINPKYAQAYFRRAFVFMIQGHYDQSAADLTQAIQISPQFTKAYYRRACVYMMSGHDDQAIADLDKVIALEPTFAEAYLRRSFALMLKGEYAEAIAAMNQIIQANPKAVSTFNRLAWLLATCPQANIRDGKKAVENATTACDLMGWKVSAQLDTLAAAYAESGDFINAVKWENEAIANQHDPEVAKAQQGRLALYEAHQPYHVEKYDPHFEAVVR